MGVYSELFWGRKGLGRTSKLSLDTYELKQHHDNCRYH